MPGVYKGGYEIIAVPTHPDRFFRKRMLFSEILTMGVGRDLGTPACIYEKVVVPVLATRKNNKKTKKSNENTRGQKLTALLSNINVIF